MRIALALKGVEYDRVGVNLLAAEQGEAANRARNPQGLVPTLEVGGVMLTQSLAIIDYLDATYPEPPLVPRDALARSKVLAQALTIVADTHPLHNLRVLKRLESVFGAEQAAREDWYRYWVRQGFDALEQSAEDGPFLGGAAPNLADICLVPQMYNARRFELDVSVWPKLVAADAACAALPAFAAAHPDRVKPELL